MFLSDYSKNYLGGDIIEERPSVIYTGMFKNGTNENYIPKENGEGNCIIRRITTVKEGDIITTRIEYPEGNNYKFTHLWGERENYNYKYNQSK